MDRIIVEADAKKTGYRYFAFISYSSKDVKWAEWIQKKLETYRLPSKIRKEHSDLPEKICISHRRAFVAVCRLALAGGARGGQLSGERRIRHGVVYRLRRLPADGTVHRSDEPGN